MKRQRCNSCSPLKKCECWSRGSTVDTARIQIHLLDACYWVKGCSSLGRLRFAAIVWVGGEADGGLCFIDIKEAVLTSAPHAVGQMPSNQAERVVTGARALSPNLGQRMMAN